MCQAEDGIRSFHVTGVQTCALPIYQGVRVEVLGLSVGKPTPKIPEDENNANFGMMLFGPREGTQLRVWMYAPERTLLGIDEEARSEERREGRECEDRGR